MNLYVEKLYRYERKDAHMSIAIPFAKGELEDDSLVKVWDEGVMLPVQPKVTARHLDGSIKYLFLRFMGDLPANKGKEFECTWGSEEKISAVKEYENLYFEETSNGYRINNGRLWTQVKNNNDKLIEALFDGKQLYDGERFVGPLLEEKRKNEIMPAYVPSFGTWKVLEKGPLCVSLIVDGKYKTKSREISFEAKLSFFAGKSYVEVSYRLINTSPEELEIGALGFYCKGENDGSVSSDFSHVVGENGKNVFSVKGINKLGEIEEQIDLSKVRTCTGYSNYKTSFTVGAEGAGVIEHVDANRVMFESNEHFSEVLYGTFFADRTDEKGGICATIFQAQQNYPKAVMADKDGISIMLVPRGEDRVVFLPGVSREQKFLLHFHTPEVSLAELDNISLIYQMPDRPVISPKVFKEAGVMPNIFPNQMREESEIMLIRRADGHNRAFGMLNWGDSMDANYTNQGRGGGKPVWVNNEYDYPHACALMYARTGTRRFLDYLLVSASHWQDVDVCHYSEDPLRIGGQIEHTRGHVIDGVIVPSHEWVEGLLDYYHFTGDERAFETAIGIGENIMRLLDTPDFAHTGEMNARETGWALRSLTALYVETGDEKWLEKSEWIVGHFRQWEEDYGHWLAPYTDNTLIRVGFMISVAVGSLMRYYRVRPNVELKDMMIRAIDDLLENCQLENGLFYYKELPSLARLGNNTLLLEAMTIGYELTGDKKYIEAGRKTFQRAQEESKNTPGGSRVHIDDAVIWPGDSSKSFGQSFLPLAQFDKACEDAKISL